MRGKFKELGYRVLLAMDPVRALDRFRQQPFDALIVDAATVGDEGRLVFQQIMIEAKSKHTPCVGVILFSSDQQDLAARVPDTANTRTLIQAKFGDLKRALDQLLASKG